MQGARRSDGSRGEGRPEAVSSRVGAEANCDAERQARSVHFRPRASSVDLLARPAARSCGDAAGLAARSRASQHRRTARRRRSVPSTAKGGAFHAQPRRPLFDAREPWQRAVLERARSPRGQRELSRRIPSRSQGSLPSIQGYRNSALPATLRSSPPIVYSRASGICRTATQPSSSGARLPWVA